MDGYALIDPGTIPRKGSGTMVDKPSNPLDLNEKEYRAMLDSSERYFSEAKRCRAGKAYLAGIVMVGAALETILMCMVCCDSKRLPPGMVLRSGGTS